MRIERKKRRSRCGDASVLKQIRFYACDKAAKRFDAAAQRRGQTLSVWMSAAADAYAAHQERFEKRQGTEPSKPKSLSEQLWEVPE